MAIVFTTALLVGTAVTVAIVLRFRPRFRYVWLITAGGTLVAWLGAFFSVSQLPVALRVPLWESSVSATSLAAFASSGNSWPFALSLLTVGVLILSAAPSRPGFPSAANWSLCLSVIGIGILAVSAANALTLVFLWVAFDLLEAGLLLARGDQRRRTVTAQLGLSTRLASIGFVLMAIVLGSAPEAEGAVGYPGGAKVGLLIVAALLRLAAVGIRGVRAGIEPSDDEVIVTTELVAGTAAFAFLAQLGETAYGGFSMLDMLSAMVALYGAWMYLRAPSPGAGRPFWVVGTGGLAVAAALRGSSSGVTAWGCWMLLGGASLYLNRIPGRAWRRVLVLGTWLGSALPFSLTASAWLGGTGIQQGMLPILLTAQAMLLAGFAHSSLQARGAPAWDGANRLALIVQRAGGAIPLAVGIVLGLWGWPGAFQLGAPAAGATAAVLGAGFAWAKGRLPALNPLPESWHPSQPGRALSIVRDSIGYLEARLRSVTGSITRTMEGESGILWSLVVLVLFVSLITDRAR